MERGKVIMSKYTTEVRYICEHFSGLSESVGYNDVEQVIKNCITKVFDFNYPIFDESYRTVLETKILRHYYTREIGLETVGLWKLKLNTKLNEIMPFYNQLYKSELIEFNPLYDVELTRERKTEGKGTKDTENTESRNGKNHADASQSSSNTVTENGEDKGTVNGTSDGTQNQNTSGNATNMYSDTPQGAITDLQGGKYLTNASVDSATNTFAGASHDSTSQTSENTRNNVTNTDGSSDSSNDGEYSSNMDGYSNTTLSNTEDYLEHVIGSNGGESFSKRLNDYRATFINIDMMIINDLEELFFGLW